MALSWQKSSASSRCMGELVEWFFLEARLIYSGWRDVIYSNTRGSKCRFCLPISVLFVEETRRKKKIKVSFPHSPVFVVIWVPMNFLADIPESFLTKSKRLFLYNFFCALKQLQYMNL